MPNSPDEAQLEEEASAPRFDPGQRELSRDEVLSLPWPSADQLDEFTNHVCWAHSWYKHIDLINGAEFIFFLANDEGTGFSAEHPRLHYSWTTTEEYRERFGFLDYAWGHELDPPFERDAGPQLTLSGDLPDEPRGTRNARSERPAARARPKNMDSPANGDIIMGATSVPRAGEKWVSEREAARFRATAGSVQGFGKSPQEALATLMQQLPTDSSVPIVIWPYNQGDAFFSEAQQARLRELKARQTSLSAEERAELEDLVAAALDATVARTKSLPLVKS